jgi:hypothetical protein
MPRGVPLPLLLLLLGAAAQLCAASESRELGVGGPGSAARQLPAFFGRRLSQAKATSLNKSASSRCVWGDSECRLSPAYLLTVAQTPFSDLQK